MGKENNCSLILSVYNGTNYLPELFDSIEKQLITGDEVLIYDDGSSDETVQYLEQRGYKVIREFDTPMFRLSSEGVQERITRNYFELIQLASNDIVVLVDQDDIWQKGKLKFLRSNPGYDLYIHDAKVVGYGGKVISISYQNLIGGFTKNRWLNFYKNRYLGCCMAFSKNSCLDKLPREIQDYYYHDQVIGLLLSGGKVCYDSRKLINYRRHGNTVTTASGKRGTSLWRVFKYRLRIVKFVLKV